MYFPSEKEYFKIMSSVGKLDINIDLNEILSSVIPLHNIRSYYEGAKALPKFDKSSLNKISQSGTKSINKAKTTLKSNGVNITLLQSLCYKYGKTYRAGFDPQKFAQHIKEIHTKVSVKELPKTILLLLVMLIASLLFQMILFSIIVTGLSAVGISIAGGFIFTIVNIIYLVLGAPIFEETAKKYANEHGFGNTYVTLFTYAEFAKYVITFAHAGVAVLTIVAYRILAAVLHFYTHYLQKENVDFTGKKSDIKNAGYKTGLAVHGLWNFCLGGLPMVLQLILK